MPFMKGQAPVRRTLKYLEAGQLVLKDAIRILSINYNTFGKHHEGAKEFVFWHLPQIQYKNPDVQVITFKNLTPTPFIKAYYESGQTMLIDIDSQPKDKVLEHLINVVGKSKNQLEYEQQQREKKDNPANFGIGCEKFCICEVFGQIPCPAVVPVPKHMRGKYKYILKDEL